jgi:LuxR family maltose regulon positive regulatory protein
MLELLDRRSLFVRRLDDRREAYRYHPLFRDLLRYELEASHPGRARELLGRAAAWHGDRGEVRPAAEYLLAAEDWRSLFDLVADHGAAFITGSELTAALRWLDRAPMALIVGDPEVALAKATMLTMSGSSRAAADLLDRLEAVAAPLDARSRTVVATLRAVAVYWGAPAERGRAEARTALALLDEHLDPWPSALLGTFDRATVRGFGLVVLARTDADDESARRHLEEAERLDAHALLTVHALGERAWLEARSGNLRQALRRAGRALEIADASGLADHPSTAAAHLALGRALRLRGEHAASELHLDQAEARARSNRREVTMIDERVERIEARAAAGRVGDGLDLLDAMLTAAHPAPWPPVAARLAAASIRLHLRGDRVDAARRELDDWSGAWTAEMAEAAAATAAATDDLVALRKAVDDWPEPGADDLTSRLQRGLWAAVLEERGGDRTAALAAMQEVVAKAEAEGNVGLLLDGSRDAVRLLRALFHLGPTPFLRTAIEDPSTGGRVVAVDLVEQLSDREQVVLRYLPSRLSNAEIADALFVSVNTLKTHLKAIYRKLSVTNRKDAIERAEALGLL